MIVFKQGKLYKTMDEITVYRNRFGQDRFLLDENSIILCLEEFDQGVKFLWLDKIIFVFSIRFKYIVEANPGDNK